MENSFNCEICGNKFVGSWTDFYGEATCCSCGTPYQLLEPSGAKPNVIYPHISVDEKWIPVFKEYWDKTHKIHLEGMFFTNYGQRVGQVEFINWAKINHSELFS